MKTHFFSKLKSILAVSILSATILTSQPAHSFVAIASWNPILMGAGLAVAMTGGIVGGGSVTLMNNYRLSKWQQYLANGVAGLGALIGLPGIIVLSAESGQKVQLAELSQWEAAKLKISDQERNQFNQEIEEANIIIDDINQSLNQLENPSYEDSFKLWSEKKDSLNPLTLSVINKILNQ